MDSCRGFTMLLVLYWHLMYFSFTTPSLLAGYLVLFRMPAFMFISGYLVYSDKYTKELLAKRSKIRLVKQLFPTVIICLVATLVVRYFYPEKLGSFSTMIYDPFKNGYWFTYVLVELFFMTAPLLFMFHKFSVSRVWRVITLLVFGVGGAVFLPYLCDWSDKVAIVHDITGLLSISLLFHYSFFFYFGMIMKNYKNYFEKICSSHFTLIAAFAAFMLLAGIGTPIQPDMTIRYIICGIAGIVLAVSIFIHLEHLKNRYVTKVLKWLSYIGTATLEIYLLHYFVIHFTTSLMISSGVKQIIDTWLEFPIFLALSIVVASVVLLFVKLLKEVGAYQYIFPDVKKSVETKAAGLSTVSA